MERLHEIYVVEHCSERDDYQVERLDRALQRNLRSFTYQRDPEWAMLAAAESQEQAVVLMESLIEQARDHPRPAASPSRRAAGDADFCLRADGLL